MKEFTPNEELQKKLNEMNKRPSGIRRLFGMKRIPGKYLLIASIFFGVLALTLTFFELTIWGVVVAIPFSICIYHWLSRWNSVYGIFSILLMLSAILQISMHNSIQAGGYVVPGEIVDLRIRKHKGRSVTREAHYHYIVNDSIRMGRDKVSKKTYNELNRGDTILVFFSKDDNVSVIYSLFPKKKTIEKFKKGVYYEENMLYYNDTLGISRYSLALLKNFTRDELALFTDEQLRQLPIEQLKEMLREYKLLEHPKARTKHFWEHDYLWLNSGEASEVWAVEIYRQMNEKQKEGLDPYSIFTKQWLRNAIKQDRRFMSLLPEIYKIWGNELDSTKVDAKRVDPLLQQWNKELIQTKRDSWGR